MKRATDTALTLAIKDAQSDLRDHAKDDVATRQFLAGVIDGLKKAKLIVAQNS